MSKPDIQQMLEDSQREFEEWCERETVSGDHSGSMESQGRWKIDSDQYGRA